MMGLGRNDRTYTSFVLLCSESKVFACDDCVIVVSLVMDSIVGRQLAGRAGLSHPRPSTGESKRIPGPGLDNGSFPLPSIPPRPTPMCLGSA